MGSSETCGKCGAAAGTCRCRDSTRVERVGREHEAPTLIHPLLPGDVLDQRFEIREEHARGAMGVVYAALDSTTGGRAAVKILLPELCRTREFQNRFARELRTLVGLSHPNIVKVLGFGLRGALPWLAMPLLEGKNLERLLASRGRLAHVEVAEVARQIGAGLRYLHARGLVHRDVKTANVFAGRGRTFTLLDLGVVLDPAMAPLTGPGIRMGTAAYMAPEQVVHSHVDHRADVYAFAVTLFELLTGRLPFEADGAQEMLRMQRFAPIPDATLIADDVPPAVSALLARALQKDPAQRLQDVDALVTPLCGLLAADRTTPL